MWNLTNPDTFTRDCRCGCMSQTCITTSNTKLAFPIWVPNNTILIPFYNQLRVNQIYHWCYMCKCNGELVDHLFLHCLVVMDLWSIILGLFGVSWVMLQSVLGLQACWQGKFGHHQNDYIWLIVPHCLMWCLWKERNSRCFEDNERSILDLKLLFFRTLLDWLVAMQNQSFPSFIDFLDSCNFCT